MRPTGYVDVAIGGFWLPEHRVIMEARLGRKLVKGESVHHKNGLRSDNRPENLELWVGPPRFGQRVTDMLAFAREIIALYESEEFLVN